MNLIGRKWTLIVHDEDPDDAVYGIERGHTDTGASEHFEAVHVVTDAAYQGAVEHARVLAEFAEWIRRGQSHPCPVERERVDAAITAIGGSRR